HDSFIRLTHGNALSFDLVGDQLWCCLAVPGQGYRLRPFRIVRFDHDPCALWPRRNVQSNLQDADLPWLDYLGSLAGRASARGEDFGNLKRHGSTVTDRYRVLHITRR